MSELKKIQNGFENNNFEDIIFSELSIA